jgi:hypothetical protein
MFADDIGNYRIPMKVRYADTVIDPGMYAISIVKETDGPYIVLSKGGQVVAKDLSIEIPASGNVSRPQVQIAKIAGQDFLRVRIRTGNLYYYAYMETKW